MSPRIGYCTNVHAGADLAATQDNLVRYALEVKKRVSPNEPMGVGLWLSAKTASELRSAGAVDAFSRWLGDVGLEPYTLNGFPYGDFHQEVVKHRVYEPTWMNERRANYTLDLIDILARFPLSQPRASISTLPIAWGEPAMKPEDWTIATMQFHEMAAYMATVEERTGRRITLCIEPEPGCVLQRTDDLVKFFTEHLFKGPLEPLARRYLGVCHDVCHAAVMFEEQGEVIAKYNAAGIRIGKVQASNAVSVDWEAMAPRERPEAFEQLANFKENRYLHQTVVCDKGCTAPTFFEDLGLALAAAGDPVELTGRWRVHFHTPIYLAGFGKLQATQAALEECLLAFKGHPDPPDFEVETYAWGVLPPELAAVDLASGIATEVEWLRAHAPV